MKRKILVLEDEENIRSFLVLNLKRSGYEVIEAETGEIALENTMKIRISRLRCWMLCCPASTATRSAAPCAARAIRRALSC